MPSRLRKPVPSRSSSKRFRRHSPAGSPRTIAVPTIGIGASSACDGQILVVDDMLGMFTSFQPKFVKRYAELGEQAETAIADYASDVRNRRFPGTEHVFGDAPKSIRGGEAA